MHRTYARWIAVLIAVSAIAAPPASFQKESKTRGSDPEHARLIAMCGAWDVELTFWFQSGGAGVTTKGTSTIRPLFDGLFVEEKIDGALNGTPFTTLSWTGYNTSTHQYEATRIATTNTIRIAESGSYDEKMKQFELKRSIPWQATPGANAP
jgi:hypothetical protein